MQLPAALQTARNLKEPLFRQTLAQVFEKFPLAPAKFEKYSFQTGRQEAIKRGRASLKETALQAIAPASQRIRENLIAATDHNDFTYRKPQLLAIKCRQKRSKRIEGKIKIDRIFRTEGTLLFKPGKGEN